MSIIWEDLRLAETGFEKVIIMKDIIIICAGGFGRETAELIADINDVNPEWNLLGFVDDNKEIQGKEINGYQVLGGIDYLNDYRGSIYTICAVADCKIKQKIISRLTNPGIRFASLIHLTAVISRSLEMGEGIIIQANTVITSNVKIADHVAISPQCGLGHDCFIDKYSTLFWNVNIGGFVCIGEGVLLGTKTFVIQERSIGSWSIIGSHSNVIRDIPQNCTAVGNPAKVIKYHS
ncbi:MAG: acetyltransferase [Halanaerobiaceae bacterium]|nr:acetyltransferase [Halanaerobiaceae bacterium]